MFNDEQLERYSRQLMVDERDLAGQEALAAARVLIVGCGGWPIRRHCIWPVPVWADWCWRMMTG